MAGRLRLFLWRHQVSLTIVYLALLVAGCGALYWYCWKMPASLDTGMTVALRSVIFQRVFSPVSQAREDLASGDLVSAQVRLERFIQRHSEIQAGQLETHAVTDAHEMLAEIYVEQGKPRKAARLLEQMARRTPLNYRLWLLLAEAARSAGDAPLAAKSYRQAFKLALNHPQVAERYLGLLSELNAFEEIVWVADQFSRAAQRGVPLASVEVGIPRSEFRRRVLEWTGIKVGHASYYRGLDLFGLPFGEGQQLSLPEELLQPWPYPTGSIYIRLRFEGVYEHLRVESLRYRTKDGETREYVLTPDRVSYQTRPHSAVES
ncbi:MAG: tetratricopeptide repeat protein [Thermoanaerobaculia bacterium]